MSVTLQRGAKLKMRLAAHRPPPFLVPTVLYCAALALLFSGGFSLTNAPLIKFYILLGTTTPKRIVDIYSLTASPLLRAGFGATVGASLWTFSRWLRWRPKSALARKIILRGGTIAAWVIAIGAFAVLLPSSILFNPMRPSDEIYVEAFPANQSALNELVRLLKAHPNLAALDQTPQNASEDSHPMNAGLERRYRQLLEAAAITRVNVSPDGIFRFQEWQYCGIMPCTDETGYSYSETPLANVLPGLDGLSSSDTNTDSAVRHLRGNWYIYYQRRSGG